MKLGNLLDRTQQAHIGAWKIGMFVFLAALAAVNLFVLPREAEYGLDAYPEFWALFGLVTALVMLWVMGKIIRPLIERHEGETDD